MGGLYNSYEEKYKHTKTQNKYVTNTKRWGLSKYSSVIAERKLSTTVGKIIPFHCPAGYALQLFKTLKSQFGHELEKQSERYNFFQHFCWLFCRSNMMQRDYLGSDQLADVMNFQVDTFVPCGNFQLRRQRLGRCAVHKNFCRLKLNFQFPSFSMTYLPKKTFGTCRYPSQRTIMRHILTLLKKLQENIVFCSSRTLERY